MGDFCVRKRKIVSVGFLNKAITGSLGKNSQNEVLQEMNAKKG